MSIKNKELKKIKKNTKNESLILNHCFVFFLLREAKPYEIIS
jgi:hypothetical protein